MAAKTTWVTWLILTLCLSMAPLLGGCAVSDKQVIAQATQTHQALQPAVINDPELSAYIERVGQRLIAAAKEVHPPTKNQSQDDSAWMFSNQMQFHLVASDTVNAFTTGGTHMYVYTGLFNLAKSEAEVAAVMAHEYGHVYARHVQKGMQRQEYSLLGAAAAGAAGYALAGGDSQNKLGYAATAAGGAAAVGQFVGMGYGRDDEREADHLGFQFYTAAGYPPEHFADFFKAMIAKGQDSTPEILSTHPSLASRVQEIDKWVAALPANVAEERRPPEADDAKFQQLKAKAAAIAKAMPKEGAAGEAQLLAAAVPNHMLPVQEPQQQRAQYRLEKFLQDQKSKPAR